MSIEGDPKSNNEEGEQKEKTYEDPELKERCEELSQKIEPIIDYVQSEIYSCIGREYSKNAVDIMGNLGPIKNILDNNYWFVENDHQAGRRMRIIDRYENILEREEDSISRFKTKLSSVMQEMGVGSGNGEVSGVLLRYVKAEANYRWHENSDKYASRKAMERRDQFWQEYQNSASGNGDHNQRQNTEENNENTETSQKAGEDNENAEDFRNIFEEESKKMDEDIERESTFYREENEEDENHENNTEEDSSSEDQDSNDTEREQEPEDFQNVFEEESKKMDEDIERESTFERQESGEDEETSEEEIIADLHRQRKEREEEQRADSGGGAPESQESQENLSQNLEDARRRFADLDNEAERWARVMKRPKREFENQGGAANREYAQAREQYMDALVNYRQNRISNIQEQGEGRQERMQEVARDTIAREADNLYDAKTNIRLEDRNQENLNWRQRTMGILGRITDGYRRLPLRYKLAASAVFIGGASGAAAIGGTTGAAIAAAAFAGSKLQKVLGGAATFTGLEGWMKKSQEKGAEREVARDFANGLEERLNRRSEEIDNRIIEITGRKRWEKYRRYIIAGTAGTLVGTGAFGKAIGGWFDSSSGGSGGSIDNTSPEPTPPEPTPPPIPEPAPDFTAEVEKGNSVWGITENELKEHFGSKFDNLNEAQQTHLIDQIKDKIAENPDKFGLEAGQDIDNLKVGQKLDFSKFMGGNALDKMLESANSLSPDDMVNIMANNLVIEDWVENHPNEALTSEKVEEILSGLDEGAQDQSPTSSGNVDTYNVTAEEKQASEIFENQKYYGVETEDMSNIDNPEVRSVIEKYDSLSAENALYVENTLNMLESSGVERSYRQALEDLYFSSWSGEESPEKISKILGNIFGDEKSKVEGFFSAGGEVVRDSTIGNVTLTLDQIGWLGNSIDGWDVVLTPDGSVSADGPLGWGVDKQPLNSDSMEDIKEKILSYVNQVSGTKDPTQLR